MANNQNNDIVTRAMVIGAATSVIGAVVAVIHYLNQIHMSHTDLHAPLDDDDNEETSSGSSAITSQSRKHGKRSRAKNETDQLENISVALGEVVAALRKFNENQLDVSNLYEEVMKTEGFDETFLASAVDYLAQNEKLGRAFIVKNHRLQKLWLDNFQKQA